MLNKTESASSVLLPFLVVILITLVGGMYLPQLSIGIAFAAVAAVIVAVPILLIGLPLLA